MRKPIFVLIATITAVTRGVRAEQKNSGDAGNARGAIPTCRAHGPATIRWASPCNGPKILEPGNISPRTN